MTDCQHWIEPMLETELSELKAERAALLDNVRTAQEALAELRAIINRADIALGRAMHPDRTSFSATYNAMALRQLGAMAESPLAAELRAQQLQAIQESFKARYQDAHPLFRDFY